MSADAAVQQWYSERFVCTDLGYKCLDWRLLLGYAPVQGQSVLNVGCGYPLDEVALAPLADQWTAVDFTPAVIERCRVMLPTLGAQSSPVAWLVADARDLRAFPDGAFTRVLDFSSGDHVHHGRDRMRAEAFRVLRPGGRMVVTYANRRFFADGREDAFGDFGYEKRQLPEEIRAELVGAGFAVVYEEAAAARSGIVVEKPA